MGDWNARSPRNDSFSDINGNFGLHPFDENNRPVRTNIVRGMLASAGDALIATCYPGLTIRGMYAPHGFFSGNAPLNLGYTAGQGFLDGLNNQVSGFIVNNLFGDPTIRLSYVKPVSAVQQTIDLSNGNATISWTAPTGETIERYEVYQSDSLSGTFTLVNSTTNTMLTDTSPDGSYVYMVRAIRVDNASTANEYDNASTGVFASHVSFTGTTGADALVLTRSLDAEPTLHAEHNGTDDYGMDARIVEHVEFVGGNGNDTLTVNLAPASTIPSGGIEYTGGSGDDTLVLLGSAADEVVAFDATTVTANDGTITLSDSAAYAFDGNGGGDDLTVADDVTVKFLDAQDLAALELNTTGTIDLGEFDVLIRDDASMTYADVRGMIVAARNGGAWDEPGITSSAAATQTNHATMLGLLTGSQYIWVNGTSFNGFTVTSSDILVKYTWYGDADFSGTVTFDDYSRIQAGFGTGTTWFQGDFDLNGVVNFDDYAKIDLGFGVQNGQLFGGPTPWQQIAQMDHFDQQYMYHLIDELEKHGIYLTEEDFLPA